MNNSSDSHFPCHCGSDKAFEQCCSPYLLKLTPAPTAEALMRSRYSAFVTQDKDYLRYSWHPDFCPADIHINPDTVWLGLTIRACEDGKQGDTVGQVEYVARSKSGGRARRLHEISRFSKYEGRWVYLDGDIFPK